MKTTVDLLIEDAAQVVTCADVAQPGPRRGAALRQLGVIEQGAVAVDDGVIVAVGASAELAARFQPRRRISAAGKVVCPGLVDPHTHVVYAGERIAEFEQRIQGATYLDIMKAGGGIQVSVNATRAASVDDLVRASAARLYAMLHSGTTTVEVKTGYGLDTDSEIKMLRAIELLDQQQAIDLVPTFLGAHAFPAEYVHDHAAYTNLIITEMLPAARDWYGKSQFAARGVPLFNDVFCEDGAFNLAETRAILEAGKRYGFAPKLHADEFTSLGGVGLAVEFGAVSVDHLDVITASNVAALANSSTLGVLLPAVTFNLGKCDYADARQLIDQGAALALATDANPGSAPCLSLPLVMALACRYQGLTPAEALNASTINAAYALGQGDRIGSIEAGKQADLLIIAAPDYRHLSYRLGENLVEQVIKSGKIID